MEENKLILTVGLPRSGKTTWAKKQIEKGAALVSMESIRRVVHGQEYVAQAEGFVWAVTKIMVKALFEGGHNTVIIDANHTTRKERNQWISSEWKREFKVFKTKEETCIARAMKENRKDIVGRIKALAKMYEPVDKEER